LSYLRSKLLNLRLLEIIRDIDRLGDIRLVIVILKKEYS